MICSVCTYIRHLPPYSSRTYKTALGMYWLNPIFGIMNCSNRIVISLYYFLLNVVIGRYSLFVYLNLSLCNISSSIQLSRAFLNFPANCVAWSLRYLASGILSPNMLTRTPIIVLLQKLHTFIVTCVLST